MYRHVYLYIYVCMYVRMYIHIYIGILCILVCRDGQEKLLLHNYSNLLCTPLTPTPQPSPPQGSSSVLINTLDPTHRPQGSSFLGFIDRIP